MTLLMHLYFYASVEHVVRLHIDVYIIYSEVFLSLEEQAA